MSIFSVALLANEERGSHGFSAHDRVLIENVDVEEDVSSRSLSGIGFRDIDGTAYHLDSVLKKGPAVFVFTSSECPLAKRYSLRLERLAKAFRSDGVSFFAVHSNADDPIDEVKSHSTEFELPFPVVKDFHGYLGRRFGATTTPQAFLVNQGASIIYRGAIDDNRYENKVIKTYLKDAVEALLANPDTVARVTPALGCAIHYEKAEEVASVTYTEHVARIFQNKCQNCHRPNQVAPFSLTSFRKTKAYATEIREQVLARNMPPWQPVPHHVGYQGDMSLDEEEMALIVKWIDQGCAEGNLAALPPAPDFPEGWALGEPDMIVSMAEEYTVGPEGEDDYRHFIIKREDIGLPEDVYVSAVDVRPGNRNTVHHVIVYVDTSGTARELDAEAPGYGYTRAGGVGFQADNSLGGWAPGNRVSVLPEGYGRRFSAEGDIVLQVHYYRTGRPEKDLTKVGLYLSKVPNPKPVERKVVVNTKFEIAPGEMGVPVMGVHTIEEDSYVSSVYPHMHQLGRRIKIDAEIPGRRQDGGKEIPLVYIKNWDFNWQGDYMFQEPIFLPKGTLIKLACVFDNTTDHVVTWGEATSDEMALGFLSVIKASDWKQPMFSNND